MRQREKLTFGIAVVETDLPELPRITYSLDIFHISINVHFEIIKLLSM